MIDIYWPGTKIVKSHNNAFTAHLKPGNMVLAHQDYKSAEAARVQVAHGKGRAFTIYSRARASK